ncbi:nucleotidyltransferase family protein [Alkalicoccus halolimnae]|uniref:Nucleotidyltransferase family protein n=1 Tax=Alkalicoccus halolimnae TaxID=1667239 RepID=A0A5C7EZN6_9BACI|nr:nucleotidyltransferase family protein [Alkalicoccus halolimnae]TXF81692.1 nucleotidyltransferase family protein [Alkalicoccus halolimnae]
MLQSADEVKQAIRDDPSMMIILSTAAELELPDWWICAGFIRSKIWDIQHGLKTPPADIDVIYFDPLNPDEREEKKLEKTLNEKQPSYPWSVKNQARMHLVNGTAPYTSSEDAISRFPETAAALGVKLDKNKNLVLTAPHGLEDALLMKVRPTPFFLETPALHDVYNKRIRKKNWQKRWEKIKIEDAPSLL